MTTTEVTEAGLYPGLSNEDYHADPTVTGSLSQSGAKTLLDKSPAHFRYELDHGRPPKDAFDFGHAAHSLVLERDGSSLVVVDANDWRTKAAQEAKAQAREEGKVPLLRDDFAKVRAMADKILEHPLASVLFDPEHGRPEQSAFWQDDESGVWLRARFDWLPDVVPGRRLVVPDYKTAVSADPAAFAKKAADFGYHIQDPWYCDALRALDVDEDPAFVFVVQEKDPPFVVTVVQLDADAQRVGRNLGRKARALYADCVGSNTWPSYSDGVELVSLPYYYLRSHAEELSYS